MADLLPIIEQLSDADSDQARADWLRRCPLSILMTYDFTIRNRLQVAGFLAGVDYLDGVLTVMRSVRNAHGLFDGEFYDKIHVDLAIAVGELESYLKPAGEGEDG
ncbi:hypothetical protein [Pararhizobium haloflavum]|uniref:hypothetical protein n=1 Tax=Pararhizobium haloflavum TaxID=2037914 RepID=UPI0012FFFCB6|nr:hypothetical protein [Pararhizobium haloflavum]